MSSRVRPRAVEVNKVLHVVRIAEDFWEQAVDGHGGVRGEYVEDDDEDLARDADDPRSQRGPSEQIKRADQPDGADREPPG